MIYLAAITLTTMSVGLFVFMEHYYANFEKHFGTPPPQPTEDDPEFMDWVERKLHLED